jgi:hypothetical protein
LLPGGLKVFVTPVATRRDTVAKLLCPEPLYQRHDMGAESQESVPGRQFELARLSLYALVALGSLGLGVLRGEGHWVLTGVVLAASGAVDLFPVDRAVDHLCDTDRQRRQLRWAGVFAFLTGALAYIALVL